jgi:hypothetical protein
MDAADDRHAPLDSQLFGRTTQHAVRPDEGRDREAHGAASDVSEVLAMKVNDTPVTGYQVREYRGRKRLGLRTVEKLTGINRGKLSWWERGADILSEEEIDRVIDAVITAP